MGEVYVNNGENCIAIKYPVELKDYFSFMFPFDKNTKKQYPLVGCVHTTYHLDMYTVSYLDDWLYSSHEFRTIPIALVNLIDEVLLDNSTNTVLHGAGFVMNESAVLLSQERRSGKSTLLYHMVNKPKIQYIDDDIIFINKHNMVVGPSLPIRMRSPVTGQALQVFDDVGGDVYLYTPPIAVENFTHLGFVVFPKYNPNQENELVELKGKRKIEMFIKNMKSHLLSNKDTFFALVKNIPAFEINYNNTEAAEQYLYQIESILHK